MSNPLHYSTGARHVDCTSNSGSNISGLASGMTDRGQLIVLSRRVIQTPKPEPRIMRYKLTDYEWAASSRSRQTSRAARRV
jgi:hypothetical protein